MVNESISKLDIFCLHRDNTDIPVDEFIDALAEIKNEGLINLIGASNWEMGRFSDARDYAIKNSKEPFTILSNNFSLAEMIEPVWPGCVGVNDRYLDYLIEEGVMLFPYKIGTNKEERRIKKHYAPKNYISVQQASSVNRNSSGDIIIKKNIQPKLNIALMYPRITPKKGYFSFKAGYFNYNTFFNDISSQDIEYIKLKVTDSVRSECEVKKFKIVLNKKRKRHVSFLLDHSGSMGDDRANELQKAVIEAIRNNSFRDKKNDFIYSIHKFDGNIKHLITSGKILDIEQALLPVTGLKGYGGSTAILDAIVQGLEIIKEDKISESKIIFFWVELLF